MLKFSQVGQFIQLISTFVGGFIVAFVQGWLLTLAMLSTIPPLVFAGAIISKVLAKMASQGQTAYAAAADLVEQTISSIRTVSTIIIYISTDYLISWMIKANELSNQTGCSFYWGETGRGEILSILETIIQFKC